VASTVWAIDLLRFVPRLVAHSNVIPSPAVALLALIEYKRFLLLHALAPWGTRLAPSPAVDAVWHEHILDTAAYRADCDSIFGRFLDHSPSFGGENDTALLESRYHHTLETYEQGFGRAPDARMWPSFGATAGGGGTTPGFFPSCCS